MKKIILSFFLFILFSIFLISCNNKKYIINFETNGSFDIDTIELSNIYDFILPKVVNKEGYKFVGWYLDSNFTEEFNKLSEETYNYTLYAKWEVLSYVIDYDLNSGSCDNLVLSFTHNEEITLPTPEKEGYLFLGWYETVDGVEVKVETISNRDYNLKAKWEKTPYIIDYNLNGGLCNNLITSFIQSEKIILPTPEKEGYNFLGWYENIEGAEVKIEKITDRDYNLIAKWENKNYLINYNLDGGSCDNLITSFKHNQEVILPTPEQKGHKFLGWYETIADIEVKVETISNKDYNLKAKWDKISYNIEYNLNGGICNDLVTTFYHGDKIILPTPEKEGYNFLGWYIDDYKVSIITNKNYTLSAKWEIKSYIINYDLDGGIANEFVRSYNHFENVELPTPVKFGYRFLGWYEEENKVDLIDNKNYNLVAKWESIIEFFIKVKYNDNVCAIKIKNEYSSIYNFISLTKEEVLFFYNEECTNLYNGDLITNELTLYLKSKDDMDFFINSLNKDNFTYYIYKNEEKDSFYMTYVYKHNYITSNLFYQSFRFNYFDNITYVVEVSDGYLDWDKSCFKKKYKEDTQFYWNFKNKLEYFEQNYEFFMYITIYENDLIKGTIKLKFYNENDNKYIYVTELCNIDIIQDYNEKDELIIKCDLNELFFNK